MDYRTYAMRVLFPGIDDHPVLRELEVRRERKRRQMILVKFKRKGRKKSERREHSSRLSLRAKEVQGKDVTVPFHLLSTCTSSHAE